MDSSLAGQRPKVVERSDERIIVEVDGRLYVMGLRCGYPGWGEWRPLETTGFTCSAQPTSTTSTMTWPEVIRALDAAWEAAK